MSIIEHEAIIVRRCECGLRWAGGNSKYCGAGHAYRFIEVEYVPAAQLAGAVEALRPFVEAYDRTGREFCPSFDGPLDLEAFSRAARIVARGQ